MYETKPFLFISTGENSDQIHFQGQSAIVRMIPCVKGDENQQWIHTKQGRLIHKVTNKCLDAGAGENMDDLKAGACKASTPSQIWFFDIFRGWTLHCAIATDLRLPH